MLISHAHSIILIIFISFVTNNVTLLCVFGLFAILHSIWLFCYKSAICEAHVSNVLIFSIHFRLIFMKTIVWYHLVFNVLVSLSCILQKFALLPFTLWRLQRNLFYLCPLCHDLDFQILTDIWFVSGLIGLKCRLYSLSRIWF